MKECAYLFEKTVICVYEQECVRKCKCSNVRVSVVTKDANMFLCVSKYASVNACVQV